MSITANDITFRKPVVVTDTGINGGRRGDAKVVSGAKHNLFPRVTKAERIAGITRYRKEFWSNENADNEIAYDVSVFLEIPSNGGDRFYLARGDWNDAQADIMTNGADWIGVGKLVADLPAGATELTLEMESDDYVFPDGALLHISNKVMTGQNIDGSVRVGDSIEFSNGVWTKIAASTDISYPRGLFIGDGAVLSEQETTREEFLRIESFSFIGNQATISLYDTVGNDYSAANTYAGACVNVDEIKGIYENWTETVSNDGSYSHESYPLALNNRGTVEDTFTITFTSPTVFNCTGLHSGSVGSGTIITDFEPINPATGYPYFSLDLNGWSGTWSAGDTITFTTHPAAVPIWLKEVVPSGTSEEPNNLVVLGWYCE